MTKIGDLSKLYCFIPILLLLGSSCTKDQIPETGTTDRTCTFLDDQTIDQAQHAFAGNWQWIRTELAFGGTMTPESEGYDECWIINRDSIAVCRNGLVEFKIQNQIHYDEHPFAGNAGTPDSTYLFFYNSGIISHYNDTLEIFESYIDGNDYWLVRK